MFSEESALVEWICAIWGLQPSQPLTFYAYGYSFDHTGYDSENKMLFVMWGSYTK